MRPKKFPTTQATRRADPPSYAIRSWEPRCFGRGGHEESLSSDKEGGKYNKKKTDNKKLDKKETERTAPQWRRTRRTAGVWREPQPPKRTIPVTGRDRYSSVVTNTPHTSDVFFRPKYSQGRSKVHYEKRTYGIHFNSIRGWQVFLACFPLTQIRLFCNSQPQKFSNSPYFSAY